MTHMHPGEREGRHLSSLKSLTNDCLLSSLEKQTKPSNTKWLTKPLINLLSLMIEIFINFIKCDKKITIYIIFAFIFK